MLNIWKIHVAYGDGHLAIKLGSRATPLCRSRPSASKGKEGRHNCHEHATPPRPLGWLTLSISLSPLAIFLMTRSGNCINRYCFCRWQLPQKEIALLL
ncbi:hypothetical protein AVEN_132820-1 [Araneus ventricosus]|uniref:Uncharacterized protein n=1 Tax=Araneus ventricosus TaxID=182803 RepID=A0A4Y2Q1T9_ARAVE|nr:hypothetical protein AVEN_132820-1 [Araneus ventricosus]